MLWPALSCSMLPETETIKAVHIIERNDHNPAANKPVVQAQTTTVIIRLNIQYRNEGTGELTTTMIILLENAPNGATQTSEKYNLQALQAHSEPRDTCTNTTIANQLPKQQMYPSKHLQSQPQNNDHNTKNNLTTPWPRQLRNRLWCLSGPEH